MRRPILARKSRAEDVREMAEWLARNAANNRLDVDVLGYPATETLCAERGGTTLLYVPVQSCLILESIGPNPKATDAEIAMSLDRIVSTAVFAARGLGHGELRFDCSDQRTFKFAQRHGFEEITLPVMRMKL